MKRKINLDQLRDIAFDNLELLLDSFGIEYEFRGDTFYMRCPIHASSDNEKGFTFNVHRKHWHCWTRCCHEENKKGIFGFVQAVLASRIPKSDPEVSFADAVNYVCKVYNGEVDVENPEYNYSEIDRIFNRVPITNSPIQPIKIGDSCIYFEMRGFKTTTLHYFGVGDYILKDRSYMRSRAMIPVHDKDGNLVSYIARSTKSYIQPKFIWTKGFKKMGCLYNQHRAVKSSRMRSSLFITEGTGDVWRLYESGVANAVCPCGLEISDTQASLINEMGVTNLIILLDNDQPGREAKFRLQRQFHRKFNLIFPDIGKKDIGALTIAQVKTRILSKLKGYY